jgi:hypothetical protein
MSPWPLPDGVRGRAVFSPDRAYRYWLERGWDNRLPRFTYVLLNPSRATAHTDDPTTRKLQHLTAANGGGSYVLVNLFASIDTHQTGLHLDTAVGESTSERDRWVRSAVLQSDRIVIGWGAGNSAAPRASENRRSVQRQVRAIWPVLAAHQLWCVGHNRTGSPRHPGRGVRNDTQFRRFVPTTGYPKRA